MKEHTTEQYIQYFSDTHFSEKLHTSSIPSEMLNMIIFLYNKIKDPKTPIWQKSIIIGVLGYFILPTDIIPDLIPLTGLIDDFSLIALTLTRLYNIHVNLKQEEK